MAFISKSEIGTKNIDKIDTFRDSTENGEEWILRRQFLEKNKASLGHDAKELDLLSQCFVNNILYLCPYPQHLIEEMRKRSQGIKCQVGNDLERTVPKYTTNNSSKAPVGKRKKNSRRNRKARAKDIISNKENTPEMEESQHGTISDIVEPSACAHMSEFEMIENRQDISGCEDEANENGFDKPSEFCPICATEEMSKKKSENVEESSDPTAQPPSPLLLEADSNDSSIYNSQGPEGGVERHSENVTDRPSVEVLQESAASDEVCFHTTHDSVDVSNPDADQVCHVYYGSKWVASATGPSRDVAKSNACDLAIKRLRDSWMEYLIVCLQYIMESKDEDVDTMGSKAKLSSPSKPHLTKESSLGVDTPTAKLSSRDCKLNKMPNDSYKALDKDSVGGKMMQKMGWEGGRLGKDKTGILEPISHVEGTTIGRSGIGFKPTKDTSNKFKKRKQVAKASGISKEPLQNTKSDNI